MIFLISNYTLNEGATQWMELAYADAFEIPTFVLLHHMTYEDLKQDNNVPPLLMGSECKRAINWQSIESDLRRCCSKGTPSANQDRGT